MRRIRDRYRFVLSPDKGDVPSLVRIASILIIGIILTMLTIPVFLIGSDLGAKVAPSPTIGLSSQTTFPQATISMIQPGPSVTDFSPPDSAVTSQAMTPSKYATEESDIIPVKPETGQDAEAEHVVISWIEQHQTTVALIGVCVNSCCGILGVILGSYLSYLSRKLS
jgi:hypothetical protein